MAFTLPADLPEDWVDDIGMIEDADFLNSVGDLSNAIKAALLHIVGGATTASVATQENTSSTSYVDLATTTDTVTATIGASGKALVFLSADINNSSSAAGYMSFAMSGANTAAASDAMAIMARAFVSSGNFTNTVGVPLLLTGLSAGSTVFKAKYRASSGTAQFQYRRIAVIPFP